MEETHFQLGDRRLFFRRRTATRPENSECEPPFEPSILADHFRGILRRELYLRCRDHPHLIRAIGVWPASGLDRVRHAIWILPQLSERSLPLVEPTLLLRASHLRPSDQ